MHTLFNCQIYQWILGFLEIFVSPRIALYILDNSNCILIPQLSQVIFSLKNKLKYIRLLNTSTPLFLVGYLNTFL